VIVVKPKFAIGQVVQHKLFDYRGGVIDIDSEHSQFKRPLRATPHAT
jgi:hemimethylated DNA binding protein